MLQDNSALNWAPTASALEAKFTDRSFVRELDSASALREGGQAPLARADRAKKVIPVASEYRSRGTCDFWIYYTIINNLRLR